MDFFFKIIDFGFFTGKFWEKPRIIFCFDGFYWEWIIQAKKKPTFKEILNNPEHRI
jgi:hypothetical protein